MSDQQKSASAKIAEYLELGGFFNPELMDPETVRDMVIDARDELKALRAALAEAKGALEPFVNVAANDIGESETDEELFQPMSARNARAKRITVGDLRTAATVFAKLREVG